MSSRQKPKKNKGATVAAVLCFVAAIAIMGTYTFMDYKSVKQQEQLAQTEEPEDAAKDKTEDSREASGEASRSDSLVLNTTKEADTGKEPGDTAAPGGTPDSSTDGGADGSTGGTPEASRTAGSGTSANFGSDSQLLWPVNGNVLMSFSMDKTVYFSTLDQYKYNPALIIAGAEGDQVLCGAPGTVKSIDVTAQTGTTVNVDLGNGYELFYGQLKEVPVKVGDTVEAKSVLGYVGQPTKYYSVEGCNVYMEMRKDGQPVNPMEYLVEE